MEAKDAQDGVSDYETEKDRLRGANEMEEQEIGTFQVESKEQFDALIAVLTTALQAGGAIPVAVGKEQTMQWAQENCQCEKCKQLRGE